MLNYSLESSFAKLGMVLSWEVAYWEAWSSGRETFMLV